MSQQNKNVPWRQYEWRYIEEERGVTVHQFGNLLLADVSNQVLHQDLLAIKTVLKLMYAGLICLFLLVIIAILAKK
jgi:hypothetical protein